MRDDTTASNGPFDDVVELFVSPDSELLVPSGAPHQLQIFASIPRQLQHLSSQIFQNGGQVHSSSRPHTSICLHPLLQLPMDTTHRKLHPTKQKQIYASKNFNKSTRVGIVVKRFKQFNVCLDYHFKGNKRSFALFSKEQNGEATTLSELGKSELCSMEL